LNGLPRSGHSASTKQSTGFDLDLGTEVGSKGGVDRLDLPPHRGDQLAAVAAADVEPQVGCEPAALVDPLDFSLVALGVDHVDAGLADDDVVDVGAGSGHAPIVENDRPRVVME
jgi:hypothetical protein